MRPQGGCGAATSDADDLAGLVALYRANEARDHAAEVEHYGTNRASIEDAILVAGASIDANGKMHSHQRRIGKLRMRAFGEALLPHAPRLQAVKDFDALHGHILFASYGHEKIGELAVYDVAERIGMYLGITPQVVYLHSGALEGAMQLIRGLRKKRLAMSDLPPELQVLTPAQAENFLCIYKKEIAALRRRGRLL